MISRRSFLKIAGLTAVAAGTGAGAAQLLPRSSAQRFALHGFIPDDDRMIAATLRAFVAELPKDARGLAPVVHAPANYASVVRGAMGTASSPLSGKRLVVRVSRLGHSVPADVLLHDDNKRVYDPSRDFNGALVSLRASLRNAPAGLMLSAEYVDEAPLAALFAGERVLVVENERGVVDKIAMRHTRTLSVDGPQGRTGITVSSHSAHVHSASCRHELCRRQGAVAMPGEVIACAPNRVLLRVEQA